MRKENTGRTSYNSPLPSSTNAIFLSHNKSIDLAGYGIFKKITLGHEMLAMKL